MTRDKLEEEIKNVNVSMVDGTVVKLNDEHCRRIAIAVRRYFHSLVPEKKEIPEYCASDEKTLAEVSYDRGFNACADQCHENIDKGEK